MISTSLFIHLYFSFIIAAFAPWLLNWSAKETMPITVRLMSMFVFSATVVEFMSALWAIHRVAPDRVGYAFRLISPMLLISLVGLWIVTKSLIKLVPLSKDGSKSLDSQ